MKTFFLAWPLIQEAYKIFVIMYTHGGKYLYHITSNLVLGDFSIRTNFRNIKLQVPLIPPFDHHCLITDSISVTRVIFDSIFIKTWLPPPPKKSDTNKLTIQTHMGCTKIIYDTTIVEALGLLILVLLLLCWI